MTLRQMALCVCSRFLNECGFGDQIRESCGGKHRDHVHKEEFGIKVLGKISCHLQSRLGGRAKVNGQQDPGSYGRESMSFTHDGLLAKPGKWLEFYFAQS
jgi:hypothetical protein